MRMEDWLYSLEVIMNPCYYLEISVYLLIFFHFPDSKLYSEKLATLDIGIIFAR